MKRELNHIDDIFRQRLHDASVAPPAHVWSNVEQALRKRRRRRFLLWLFAGAIAGAGLWAMMSQTETRLDPTAAQQIFSENKDGQTAGRQEAAGQAPQFKSTESPNKNLSLDIENTKAVGKNLTAKRGAAMRGVSVPILEHQKEALKQIASAEENSSATGQTAPIWGVFPNLLALEARAQDHLAFSRKNTLPKAKPLFIRKKKDPKYCYDFARNPTVWMVDAYVGPLFPKRVLNASEATFEPYRQMRLATERRDWAFNAGLRGSLLLGRHFLLRTGLHYEQMTEVFEYYDPNYVKYLIEIIQIPGEPDKIDTIGVDYGGNTTKTYNRYGVLDIPFEAGLELRHGRFGVNLNGGVSLNLLFWKRGAVLGPDSRPVPFTPGERGAAEVFRSRVGWSASASAQFFAHLNPRLRVFVEPYVRRTMQPVTLDNQPVEQRHRTIGVKLGVTKILN